MTSTATRCPVSRMAPEEVGITPTLSITPDEVGIPPCPIKPAPCPLNLVQCPIKTDAPTLPDRSRMAPDECDFPKEVCRLPKVIEKSYHRPQPFPNSMPYEERVDIFLSQFGLNHQLIVLQLPPNTTPSPGGTYFYQKIHRVSCVYIDVKGKFAKIGKSEFIPYRPNPTRVAGIVIKELWKAWGIYRVGGVFNLPTLKRLTNIITIAALTKVGYINAIYSTRQEKTHRVGTYHNPDLFWEMPDLIENGNEWDEKLKRFAPGKPKPSWVCHIWIREGSGYRRITNTPSIHTFRWERTSD